MRRSLAILSAAIVLVSPATGGAQSVADFYRGKTISAIVGFPPGASNDFYMRALSRHLGRHLPGNPNIVMRNMPGGGSLVAANHIFNVAPKDGTVLGLIAPTAPLEERLGAPNIRFKAARFNWVGRMAPTPAVTFMAATSSVKSIKDAMEREATMGATGRTSAVTLYPTLLNHVVGTKFKIVLGYKGSADAVLALERGEVEGHTTTWDGVKSRMEKHLRDKTINIIVQYGLKRHAELPDIPTSVELGRTPEQVEALRVFANATEVGRFVLTTPDTPPDRLAALRRGFDAMVKDEAFIAELKQLKVDLGPLSGEELQKLVAEVAEVSPAAIARVRALYPVN